MNQVSYFPAYFLSRRVPACPDAYAVLRQTDAPAASSHLQLDDASDGHDLEDGEDYDGLDEAAAADPLVPDHHAHKSVYADVRGAHMLKYTEFYQYFSLMGLLTGIGLMTINNIGSDVSSKAHALLSTSKSR